MEKNEILKKAEANEGLTVEEIMEYQKLVKPKTHTYGKYGSIAKRYLEEHNQAKLWALAGDLPEYLHGIDKQAEELYETMYGQLSKQEEFKKTGDYMTDVQKENMMKNIIEEAILNQIVYEKE